MGETTLHIQNGVLGGSLYSTEPHVEIPEGVIAIRPMANRRGSGVFENCRSLETVALPEGLEEIGDRTFCNTALKSIQIPATVKVIGESAFEGCKELTEVVIPEGVTVIQPRAFAGCVKLEKVVLPSTLRTIEDAAFECCEKLVALELPADLEKICATAFDHCEGLKTLVGLTEKVILGDAAFSGCRGLADADGMLVLNGVFFGYFGEKAEVTVPEGVHTIAPTAFSMRNTVTKVTLPAGLKTIGWNAFWRCENLEEINIPEGVETIEHGVFDGCKSLRSVILPDSITKLETHAFSNCHALTEVRLPAGLKELPWNIFSGCQALKSVEIPETVTVIGGNAFYRCFALESIKLPPKLTGIGNSAFGECVALEEVHIPDSVTDVSGFYGCTNLRKINMPASLKRAEGSAFEGCKKILTLTLPAGVESGWGAYPKEILVVLSEVFDSAKAFLQTRLNRGSSLLVTIGDLKAGGYKVLMNEKCEKLRTVNKNGQLSWKVYDNVLAENECKFPGALAAYAMLCRLRWPVELEENTKARYIAAVTKNIKKVAPYVNLLPEDGLLALLEEIGALTAKNKKTILPLMGIGEAPEPKKQEKKEEKAEGGEKTPAQLKKEWNIKKLPDGTLRLTSYKGQDQTIVVPAVIGKDIVTEIGDECMTCVHWSRASAEQQAVRKKITSVTVSEGIKKIGEQAFFLCESLETVTLPAGLEEIGNSAFARCDKLRQVQMPEGVQVGIGVFAGCKSLADENGFAIVGKTLYGCYSEEKEVVVPAGVERVSSKAFNGLEKLQAVIFPEGVKYLEDHAIDSCRNLKTVTLPASVKEISYGAFGYGKVLVRGFSGGIAEEVCKDSSWLKFESIGQLEKSDFEIENGVLIRYNGKDKVVVIPEGVEAIIGYQRSAWDIQGAFENNETVEEVVIPEGVTTIGTNAFCFCKNLRKVQFPSTLVECTYRSFEGTVWKQEQKGPAIYAGKVLLRWIGDGEEVTVREGTRKIGNNAFELCRGLKKVVLPEGVESIGMRAFTFCNDLEEMCVPASLKELGEDAFYGTEGIKRCYGGVLHQTEPLPAKFKVFYTGDAEDTAWLVLYQPEQSWRKGIRDVMNDKPEQITPAVIRLAELIRGMETLGAGEGNRAGAFAMDFSKIAGAQALSALYEALKEKGHPVVKKLDKDADFTAAMEGGEEDLSKLHPVEAMVVQKLMHTPAFEKVLDRVVEGVPYADTQELCAKRVLAFIAYEYIRQYDPEDAKYVSMYETACKAYAFSPAADEAAAALDSQKLQEALLQLAEQYDGEYWIPFARYADDRNTVSLLSKMRDWDDWYAYAATGRKNIIIARSGLLLNSTKAAMLHLDKVGALGAYAKMRGTDADTLRDTVLAEFGFDENREIRYDLGGNVAIVTIDDALALTILDQNAGKSVKSIPKKGADPELYEKAKVAFSDLKKNIKKVITNRKHILFGDFLSGAEKPADKWKQSYVDNPVLNSVARLVVWLQAGKTFILAKDGAVDCFGAPYTITDAPIGVAHPLVMRQQLESWRSYFTDRGLKQPFEQVWEPVYDPAQIRPERYQGCNIPIYRTNNKEQHGISAWGLTAYSEEFGFTLADCEIQYTPSEGRFIPGVTDDATYELGEFTFKQYTRYVNHIVYLFDKWTIIDRLLQDDVTVESMLDGFTPAQIREFVLLTTEKGCVNCSAMLLNYQSKHFSQLDPLAEFTLDI